MTFLSEYETTREWRMYREYIDYVANLYNFDQPVIPGVVGRFQEFGSLFMDRFTVAPRFARLLGERGIVIPEVAEWFLVGWREQYGDGRVEHNDILPRPKRLAEEECSDGKKVDSVYLDSQGLGDALTDFLDDVDTGASGLRGVRNVSFTNGKKLPLEFYWCRSQHTVVVYESENEETIDYFLVKRENLYRVYRDVFGVEPDTLHWITKKILSDWEWAVQSYRIFSPVLREIQTITIQEYLLKRKIAPRYRLPHRVVRMILGYYLGGT